ncbi:TetR/AcrR family transcriptional regulator [Parachitinimonas caeni]|uniref:TetR/AcrR family transcriptional regulator n=1 Tax=Parachitinimonas caeni TaxID=3031301 RepID=A0ABT7E1H1_9NEIS|nr:TetR/AcrR family transcriptional regulator [Parachitinimonas caeni]MDK2125260.1 TetR/AcrR family transcriptional regulator [Parachitinimonas caeni]
MPPIMPASGVILPAEERRAKTVETVVELAAEQNPNDITTAAIAERMGVTQGALFRHFANKDAILQAVVNWVAERLLSRVDTAAQQANGPKAALAAVFTSHIGFIAEHPGIPRLLLGELQKPGQTMPKRMVKTLVQSYRERVEKLLQEGKQAGEFAADLDEEAAATLYVGTIQGLVVQTIMQGNAERLKLEAQRVYAIFQRGLEPR